MILHTEDLRYLLQLLGREGSHLHELAEYYETIGRTDQRNKVLSKIAQVDRLRPIFSGSGRRMVRTLRETPGRPRKGCEKIYEGMVVS